MKQDDAPSYQAVNNTLYTRSQKKKRLVQLRRCWLVALVVGSKGSTQRQNDNDPALCKHDIPRELHKLLVIII